jgi:hypothetical protein
MFNDDDILRNGNFGALWQTRNLSATRILRAGKLAVNSMYPLYPFHIY